MHDLSWQCNKLLLVQAQFLQLPHLFSRLFAFVLPCVYSLLSCSVFLWCGFRLSLGFVFRVRLGFDFMFSSLVWPPGVQVPEK